MADGAATTAETSTGPPARSPFTLADVEVVMGTYNEEAAIATVLEDIARVSNGAIDVICVDGSDDRTPAIAREHGATVIEQPPRGYGIALERGLRAATRPVVMTTDCDDTYPMDAIEPMLERINQGADVVSGDRLSGGATAMPPLNRLGNRVFAVLASALVGQRLHDVTTGMRAYRRSVLEAIAWTENTGLSAELLMRPAIRGYDVEEVEIAYGDRLGETTLDPIRGGAAIGWSILRVGLTERFGHR